MTRHTTSATELGLEQRVAVSALGHDARMADPLRHPVAFTGPMVLGGASYSLAELARVPAASPVPTGLQAVDALTRGGLVPGMVCGITGPPRCGATLTVTRMAATLSITARVLVANDHVPTLGEGLVGDAGLRVGGPWVWRELDGGQEGGGADGYVGPVGLLEPGVSHRQASQR